MCDMCENYRYDEDLEEYFCDIELDEDEYLKFLTSSNDACPYFRADDEYRIVRKQNWQNRPTERSGGFFIMSEELRGKADCKLFLSKSQKTTTLLDGCKW